MAAVHSPSITPPSAQATAFPSLATLSDLSVSLTPVTLASSILVLVVSLLILEQSVWRWRKKDLPGWKWQIVSSAELLSLSGSEQREADEGGTHHSR